MARPKKEVTEETNGETMTAPNFPKFSTTLYFYAVASDKRFPGQVVINGATDDEFAKTFQEVMEELTVSEEDSAVTYEPREVQSANYRQNTPTRQPVNPPVNLPMCPIHQVQITQKVNRRTGIPFISCSMRNPDGTYCNWSPPKEGQQ